MNLLIDAFNLLYKIDGLDEYMFRGDLAAAMAGLKKVLGDYKKKSHHKGEIHVFFDGKRKNGDPTKRLKEGNLNLYYSHDLTADHLIMEFIKRNPTLGNLCVVSTDKEIRNFAHKHKCKRYTSEEFSEILTKKPESKEESLTPQKQGDMSSTELEYWKDMFSKRG